jgi:DNA-damage-inducible protein D
MKLLTRVEFWLARELQNLLGYSDWRNFLNAVEKAKESCKTTGEMVSDHFVDVTKMIELGKSRIKPEQLLPEEDIKKLERRVASTDKGVEKKKWKSRK